MAKKTGGESDGSLRGTKLIKKAIEAGRAEAFAEPEPVPAGLLKKLVLPNGEGISSSMKELLKVDAGWLGMDFDDEEGDIEAVTFEEAVDDFFGEDGAVQFGEACELFDGDCVVIGGESESLRVLYVGEPDESGEYAVLTASKAPEPWVQIAPFDVWVAQQLGVLPEGARGAVPPAYESAAQALADVIGDGRLGFAPTAGEAREEEEDDEEDEEDDEDDDGDDDVSEADAPQDDDEEKLS